MATKPNLSLGQQGELVARQFLEAAGYKILGVNIKLGNLEIDLIASHQGWLYFFEVKTKSTFEAINNNSLISKKQLTNLKKAAHIYAAAHKLNWNKISFDLLAIEINKERKIANLKRYRDIFS